MNINKKVCSALVLSATVCGSTAFAQQSSNINGDDRNRGGENGRAPQVDPRGWVAMAVDYNNDGRYDAVETIYIYDLEKARQQSDRRRNPGDQKQEMSNQKKSDSQSRSQQQQIFSVTAKIDSLQSMNMVGMDKKFQVAKVSTDEDKQLAVWLGQASDLSKLNLSEGDQIEVRGCKGRINDRTVMIAKEVRHDGQQVSVKSPGKTKMKRVKAEVLQTRTVKFRNLDQPHIVARVRTPSGSTEMVNMGPKSKYENVEIGEGTEVKLLVRQGRLNGQEALIAQEVNVNGKTVKLPRPEDRTRFSNRPKDENRRGNDDNRV